MEYYNPIDNRPRLWGAIALLLYLVALGVMMWFINISIDIPEESVEGILVEFGEDFEGSGEEELTASDVATSPTPEPLPEPLEELMTDPNTEVEVEQPTEPTPTIEERVVNQNALFPGRKEESTSTSQGDSSESVGNQGGQSGGDSGSTSSTTGEGDHPTFELKDRSVVGELPLPVYNADAAGKVIIDITVDEFGSVKTASYRAQGSTTNNSRLVAAAQAAALKAKFTQSEQLLQGGTITYIFKMN